MWSNNAAVTAPTTPTPSGTAPSNAPVPASNYLGIDLFTPPDVYTQVSTLHGLPPSSPNPGTYARGSFGLYSFTVPSASTGCYRFHLSVTRQSNAGMIDFVFTGAYSNTFILDTYQGQVIPFFEHVMEASILTPGVVNIEMKVLRKNPTASGYNIYVRGSGLWWHRVGNGPC